MANIGETDRNGFTTVHVEESDGVWYDLAISLDEESEIDGSFSDSSVADYVREQIAAGNPWAWCVARVTARAGEGRGVDYLGSCSYRDTSEFVQPGGYFDDMKRTARADLVSELKLSVDVGNAARATLAKLSGNPDPIYTLHDNG